MEKIIVTVTDIQGNFFLDIELLTKSVVGEVKNEILYAVKEVVSDFYMNENTCVLWNSRRKSLLSEDTTFEQAGVWNGDYLVIRQREKTDM